MDLYEAIGAVGFDVPEAIVWDAKIHRFASDADRRHSQDAWYVAFDDARGKAASFGSWRDGSKHTWSNGTGRQLTAAELDDIDRQAAAAKKAEQASRNQAALRAQRLYEQVEATIAHSGYLARKGIECPEGVRAVNGLSSRAFGFEGIEWPVTGLIVPMADRKGDIRGLQLIPEDAGRKKLFMKGGQTAGVFHVLGDLEGATKILIAEGLATAQSLHQATGLPAVVAFSAGNLDLVAAAVRGRNATADIVLCADDDEAGRRGAEKAAKVCNGRILYPGGGINDFNDLHQAKGLEAVKVAVLGEAEESENEDWRSDLLTKHRTDGSQYVKSRVNNIMLILRNGTTLRGRIRYNEFSQTVEIDGQDISDGAVVRLMGEIERDWITEERVGKEDVANAIEGIKPTCSYHPVRDYLDGLRWDGVSRIEEFFSDRLETSNDPYHRGVGKALFISGVGRIYSPGLKVDLMVIVEGAQGQMKSSMWEALGGDWYSDITDDINTKDFQAALSGVWLADLGELDQFGKAESSRIKSIVSIRRDRLRRPYARFHQNIPRQTILVGSSNRSDWINDPTGGRRFLPVSCRVDRIDIAAVRSARDQLWAEAVHRFKAGEQGWWDVPDAKEHQRARYHGDPWQEPIEAWLFGLVQVTAHQILTECLRIELAKQTKSDETRVGNVMAQLENWTKKNVWFPGIKKQKWAYVRVA